MYITIIPLPVKMGDENEILLQRKRLMFPMFPIVEFRANKRLIISLPPGRDAQKRNAPIIDFVEETRMTVPRHRLNRRTGGQSGL